MKRSFSLDKIDEVAAWILTIDPVQRHFAFFATMGSGKTTLIRALCRKLEVEDNVTSPTYAIINEYGVADKETKVFHMDWYRLKNIEDAIEAGVQDTFTFPDAYCFVEWPEIAEALLPTTTQRYLIEIASRDLRTI